MELADDLDAFVLGDDDAWPDVDEALEPPPDADRANAMLRVLRGVEREVEKIDALAAAEVARIEAWRHDRVTGLVKRREQVTAALEQWMRAVNRLNPKRKSEQLPNGKLQLRKPSAGTVEVHDLDAFVAWHRDDRLLIVREYLRTLVESHASTGGIVEELDDVVSELLRLVLDHSELARTKVEPVKDALKECIVQLDHDEVDGDQLWSFVHEGEVIPGVALRRSTVDTFKVTTA